jgi:hypothetical protein
MAELSRAGTGRLFRAIDGLIQPLIGLLSTVLQYLVLRIARASHWPRRTCSCVSSWRCFKSGRSSWTLQQLREAIPGDRARDRDAKFSHRLNESIRNLRLQILRTPVRTPQANDICERTIGAIRRGCLDYLIPLGEEHLYRILADRIRHFNAAKPTARLVRAYRIRPRTFQPSCSQLGTNCRPALEWLPGQFSVAYIMSIHWRWRRSGNFCGG